jgi:hypothetical protein
MGKNKVITEVEIYEVNDVDVPIEQSKALKVYSHWNRRDFVVLKINKIKVTVVGRNLINAINNAQNVDV